MFIHTWMEMKFMTSTRFICNIFLVGVALSSVQARGAFQNTAPVVAATTEIQEQGVKLTKDQTPITESTVLKETAKLLPRFAKVKPNIT